MGEDGGFSSQEVALLPIVGPRAALTCALIVASSLSAGCLGRDSTQGSVTPGTYPPGQQPYQQQPGYPQQQPGYPQQYPQQQYPQQPYPQQPGYTQQPTPTQPQQPFPTTPQQPFPTTPAQPTPVDPNAPAPAAPGGFQWPFPIPGMPGTTPAPAPGGQPSSGAATAIDPNFASVATVPLMAFAQQEAPGMTREGQVAAGQYKEGQILEQPFQMLPNKCYTVLAVGAGVQEVDISIVAVTPIPQASGVLAQDQGSGASASLGGKGNCYKWSFPFGINAKFVVKATRGQGVIASQLYSK